MASPNSEYAVASMIKSEKICSVIGGYMPSIESIKIRKNIQKDTLRKDLTIIQQRKIWEDYAETVQIPEGINENYEKINGINCLWLIPLIRSNDDVIVYIHGGGLIEGSVITHREFASHLSLKTNRAIIIIDYSLAPENPYPIALKEIQLVYKKLIENRFEPKNIYWGADSSGTSLALSALIQLRNNNVSLPSKVFFLSGLFDHSLSGESMSSKKDIDPFTSKEVLEYCNTLYSPDIPLDSPEISPLFNNLSNLPEILLQVGEDEILLSDSVRLFEKIRSIGGKIELDIWEDMWHVWQMYIELPESDYALEKIKLFLDK